MKYSVKLDDAAMSELKGKKWVLRFVETKYTKDPRNGMGAVTYYHSDSTIVGDVTILRLKFETDGITYNLGVIDNKQSGSKDPVNETEIDVSLNNNGKTIAALIMLILAIILLAPILPYILKAIVWVLCLPYKAITAIIKTIKDNRR